jgi:UDP-N-acetylmuramoylalanine--D-glutamate ligase
MGLDLKSKRVCVFGLGKSGLSAFKFLLQEEADVWAVNKGDPPSWEAYQTISEQIGKDKCLNEDHAATIMAESQLIILSPGIPRSHPALARAHRREVPIWSEIELASRYISAPIIAITGSNGKTTTTTLLGEMMKETNHHVFIGGNIGTPLCDYALKPSKVDFILLEVSSFQLESMESFRPKVAMLLNIFPNHGERYPSVEEYAAAKFNITKRMSGDDHFIYRRHPLIDEWAVNLCCHKYSIDTDKLESIKAELENFIKLDKFKLPGQHNLTNLYFCYIVFKVLGLRLLGVQKVIDNFHGVSYRMQRIPSKLPFVAFNDAKSTNWDATMTAIQSLQAERRSKDLYVILGGQRRGRGDSLAPYVTQLSASIDKALLIGDTTEELAELLIGKVPLQRCYRLEDALSHVCSIDFDGILLFSPGLPSFDQFDNYQKRGEAFNDHLQSLAE